jgi:hypothetical protein
MRSRAVCSLLHYSVGSPRLAVSQPAVLWCSDFPPVALRKDLKFEICNFKFERGAAGDHPACSATSTQDYSTNYL